MPSNLSSEEKHAIRTQLLNYQAALAMGDIEAGANEMLDAVASIKQKAIEEERERIGKELRDWFENSTDEFVEDAIERITGLAQLSNNGDNQDKE